MVVGPLHYSPGNYNFPRSTNKIKIFDEISSDRLHPQSWGLSDTPMMGGVMGGIQHPPPMM